MNTSTPHLVRLAPVALSLLLLAGCGTKVVNPVSGQAERSVMDEQTEIAEGRKAHQAVLAEYGVLANPKLQAYVNGVGQKLAKESHRANLAWTFTVLDSPDINAFALPGGYVYVTRGIMAYLESEADLAGVLGHEIGHVTARHGAQRATSQRNAGIGVMAATVLGVLVEGVTGVSGTAQAASQIGQGVAQGRLASYSREQETQADQLGAEYLSRTRYNPRNMIDVIQVLKRQERFVADRAQAEGRAAPSGANWLASHPSNDKRLADIQQVAARYTGTYDDDGQARYLQAIEGLPFGDTAAKGLVRGQHFYHQDLGIALTAPPGWQVQNADESVTVVNGAMDAGLVMRLLPAQAGNGHEDIIRNVVKPVDGRTEKRSFNGLSATHFAGTRRNAQGQAQGVQVSVVSGPGSRNYLMQYLGKDAASLQRADAQLQQAESSFRAMTAADRAVARPWVLRTVPYPRGGFAELARSSPLNLQAEAYLKLLNGVYGGGPEPRPGSPVKVVQ
ncbi:MAG: M48 family metalloprotease [Rubrivivax sp.]|nr:M48 family metalloprotease [Rubrivivax sp.]